MNILIGSLLSFISEIMRVDSYNLGNLQKKKKIMTQNKKIKSNQNQKVYLPVLMIMNTY